MATLQNAPRLNGRNRAAPPAQPRLPDPKLPSRPYRPFTCDPGWSEAWWWLGVPVLVAAFTIGSYQIAHHWYERYVLPECHGILELSHFFIPLVGLSIAGGLLFKPFVRARPLVFTVSLVGALGCLYIAGEEMSWGQHIFHWNTPAYWATVNHQQETNLHNAHVILERLPRSMLEVGIFIRPGRSARRSLLSPASACRVSLFLPPTALVTTALGPTTFKLVDWLQPGREEILKRPSETIETYFFFFILAYLIVYARRIKQLEAPPK